MTHEDRSAGQSGQGTEPVTPAASAGDIRPTPGPDTQVSARRKALGIGIGVVAGLLVYLVMPDGLAPEARLTAAVAVLMAVWWMTEATPLAATAIVPLVLFPPLGVASTSDAAAPYASETVFLLMGGYVLGQGMQRWNLHRRLALLVLRGVGTNPIRLVVGFMVATAFLSMWMSNAATTLMMLPIGVTVLLKIRELNGGRLEKNFATALMLAIAYSATIGGIASLIGAPPNALLAAYLSEQAGMQVTFLDWLMLGGPIAVVFLVVAWFILTRVVFRIRETDLPGGREVVRAELDAMGPVSSGERVVIGVFGFAIFSWVVLPLLADTEVIGGALPWLGNITDAGVAMTVALLLFLLPVRDEGRTQSALDWESANRLPWGMLLLVGGGLSLSTQITGSGLANWIGESAEALGALPMFLVLLVVVVVMLLLTELTSNTATAATFIPIAGAVALGVDVDILVLVLPVALAVQCAFMLPVATPPNAMAYGTGHVTMGQLIRGGAALNVAGLVLIVVAMYTLVPLLYGVSP